MSKNTKILEVKLQNNEESENARLALAKMAASKGASLISHFHSLLKMAHQSVQPVLHQSLTSKPKLA